MTQNKKATGRGVRRDNFRPHPAGGMVLIEASSFFVLKKVAGLPVTRPVWLSGSMATPWPDALASVPASL